VHLGVLEHVIHRVGDRPPPRFFYTELASPNGRDFIRARSALVFSRDRSCFNPTGLFHPMEARIQRALLNPQRVRKIMNVGGDSVAVQRTSSVQDGEDQERQRALQRVWTRRHT
jgi:hypothetical protein